MCKALIGNMSELVQAELQLLQKEMTELYCDIIKFIVHISVSSHSLESNISDAVIAVEVAPPRNVVSGIFEVRDALSNEVDLWFSIVSTRTTPLE